MTFPVLYFSVMFKLCVELKLYLFH